VSTKVILTHRTYGNDFLSSTQFYDCVFTPKSFHIKPLKAASAQRVEFLPYAYDPWCHYPVKLNANEREQFTSDISFVGTWETKRAESLEALIAGNFPYRLTIWGNQWERLSAVAPLRKFVQFKPAVGETQAKVFAGTKIALAFLSPPDLHTARTFEIPAYGAFMLAERTPEHTSFFEEGREIACFEGAQELRQKIDYYLSHDEERRTIAKAAHDRVIKGGHSYVDRMRRVLEVYQEISGDHIVIADA
jgi:spore maturation protein CgeB